MQPDLYASDEELATFFARPGYDRVRATLLILGHTEAIAEIDAIVARVRKEVWRDLTVAEEAGADQVRRQPGSAD